MQQEAVPAGDRCSMSPDSSQDRLTTCCQEKLTGMGSEMDHE